jgi:phosphoglycolate phosphatase-like HAD superfamily hydrolase
MAVDFKKIKAICFDVDGTLSDTDDLWVARFVNTLKPLQGLVGEIRLQRWGRSLVMTMETPGNLVYEILDRMHLDDDVARLYNWMAIKKIGRKPRKFWIIPNIKEMLVQFHPRYPMAVVSARDEAGTLTFLKQFELDPYFKTVVTSQTCKYTKPFPDPVHWAAEKMGVPPENCLMVGDTTVDIRAGKAAGAQTVGVLCGFGTERELRRAGADLILKSTHELMDLMPNENNSLI